jgi:hypothetical protein
MNAKTQGYIAVPILSIILIIAGAYFLNNIMSLHEVTAIVTSIDQDVSHYHATIRFTTATGEVVNTDFASEKRPGFVGSKISILYDPSNPSNIRVNDVIPLWVVPSVAILVGSVMMVLIIVTTIKRTRAKQPLFP